MRLLALALLLLPAPSSAAILPVEVVGGTGTVVQRTLSIPAGKAVSVAGLWLHTHNISYADKASVRVNSGEWVVLSNSTCTVAEPGKTFGGIGGAFRLLKLTVPLPTGTVVDGPNVIRFRFNGTDGVSSGYRVIGMNFVTAAGASVVPVSSFVWENPITWGPPIGFESAAAIVEGERLFTTGALQHSPLVKTPMAATCSGCHARDGRDLKYFAYSNTSIIERSKFHGLSGKQGKYIAAYIRTRPGTAPGRPYNPPYQPGPGLDSKPVSEWSAGAGYAWILDRDTDTIPYLFPGGADRTTIFSRRINQHEIPVALPMPDWFDWLPRVHPKDAWGAAWEASEALKRYDGSGTNAYAGPNLRGRFSDTVNLAAYLAGNQAKPEIATWGLRLREFLLPVQNATPATGWTPELSDKVHSTGLWQIVKQWEMATEFGLEGMGVNIFGPKAESRTWFDQLSFSVSPFMQSIRYDKAPNTGVNGSPLKSEYLNNAWYHLALVLNVGNGQAAGTWPIDWPYNWGHFHDLWKLTARGEFGRYMTHMLVGMQEFDRATVSEHNGWGAVRTPGTFGAHPSSVKMFLSIPPNEKVAIYNAVLGAWFDKNRQFTAAQWVATGSVNPAYVPGSSPVPYDSNLGDRLWHAIPVYRAITDDGALLNELADWGKTLYPLGAWGTLKVGADGTGG